MYFSVCTSERHVVRLNSRSYERPPRSREINKLKQRSASRVIRFSEALGKSPNRSVCDHVRGARRYIITLVKLSTCRKIRETFRVTFFIRILSPIHDRSLFDSLRPGIPLGFRILSLRKCETHLTRRVAQRVADSADCEHGRSRSLIMKIQWFRVLFFREHK